MSVSARIRFILMLSTFIISLPPQPTSTLFPYTTLFRSPFERGKLVAKCARLLRATGRFVLRIKIKDHLLRSEEHTSELQSLTNLVCRLLLEKKKAECCSKKYL